MVVRRCPQCHTAGDDQYGFCIKCGYEYPTLEKTPHTCPLCFYENPEEAEFCVKCGSPLIFKQNPDATFGPIIIQKKVVDSGESKPTSATTKLLIVLGYIFSILGGLLGLIIAIYLITRKDPVAKKHGRVQLAIFIFYLVLLLVLILTGAINQETLIQYSKMNFANLTNLNV